MGATAVLGGQWPQRVTEQHLVGARKREGSQAALKGVEKRGVAINDECPFYSAVEASGGSSDLLFIYYLILHRFLFFSLFFIHPVVLLPLVPCRSASSSSSFPPTTPPPLSVP